jgi:hypothetical protein
MWLPVLIAFSPLMLGMSSHLTQASAEIGPVDAVGRLLVEDRGVCTAFIVRSIEKQVLAHGQLVGGYENWIVSAGHCLGSKLVFVQHGVAYPIGGILGYSSPGLRGHDVMVGVFLSDRRMPTLEPAFGEYPQPGDKLLLLGYGRGALMMRAGPVLGYDERGHLVIENFASPGNSGGPVIIPGTRRVVGVGIETTVDQRPGVPAFLCGLGACAVKPPYYAAHIDWLKGLVSFR